MPVRVDTRELERFGRALGDVARRQGPFAIARGLTRLAKGAQDDIRGDLAKSFTLRNQGLKRAITFDRANKRDKPLQSVVGVMPWAPFLALQARGGEKRAKGSRVAIPTRIVQRTTKGRVKKPQTPRRLRQRKGLAEEELAKGRIRVHRRGAKPSLFYFLRRRVRIPKRWPFVEEVEKHVIRNGDAVMRRSLEEAFATARR